MTHQETKLPKPDLWHDPKTGHWKKLTKPDRPTYEPYYTADTVRRLVQEAEQRMKERCFIVAVNAASDFSFENGPSQQDRRALAIAAAIKELK